MMMVWTSSSGAPQPALHQLGRPHQLLLRFFITLLPATSTAYFFGCNMVSRRPREAATPRQGVSRVVAAATAAAAITLAMVTTSTFPVDAFVTPPAAFPSPTKTLQRDTTAAARATATTAAAASPLPRLQAAAMTTAFSRESTATHASKRPWIGAKLRLTAGAEGGQQRFSSSLGRPLRSSSSDSSDDSSAPEGAEGGEGAADPAERLREKLETIASTPAPLVDGEDGPTQKEQEELDEANEGKKMGEESVLPKASQAAKSIDPFSYADGDDEEDAGSETYEEIVANMTKPLGITIEESTDKAHLVYITSVGEKAEAAGLRVGDVLTGASAVFGDGIWSVKEKNIAEIRSLVRCRSEPYSFIRVERGHIPLEERCAPGFDEEDLSNCWMLPDDMLGSSAEECELNPNYGNLWAAVYEDELEVLTGESAARAAGVSRGGLFGTGAGGGGAPKKGNEGPPPKQKPGPGSFNGETFTGDSWNTGSNSF